MGRGSESRIECRPWLEIPFYKLKWGLGRSAVNWCLSFLIVSSV